MGRKKDKWTKKTVNFYRYVFKFEPPYKILIDGNFVAISQKKKFDMKTQIGKLLDENIHLVIPSCVYKELQEIDSKLNGILSLVSSYKITECSHSPMDPVNCIRTYIGKKNKEKYFVCTQDPFLRSQLRKIPGVPLIFFDQNMLLVDKISAASLDASQRREGLKEEPQKDEKKILTSGKDEIKQFLIDEMKNTKYYKDKLEQYKLNKLMGKIRKKAKGPNPLSVKKKQSYYDMKEKDFLYKEKMKEINEKENANDECIVEDKKEEKDIKDENVFIKRKRMRTHKKKSS